MLNYRHNTRHASSEPFSIVATSSLPAPVERTTRRQPQKLVSLSLPYLARSVSSTHNVPTCTMRPLHCQHFIRASFGTNIELWRAIRQFRPTSMPPDLVTQDRCSQPRPTAVTAVIFFGLQKCICRRDEMAADEVSRLRRPTSGASLMSAIQLLYSKPKIK